MPGKIKNRKHQKTLDRIELAVRLEFMNLGFTDPQIAQHLGMNVGAFNMLKRTLEYKRVHTEYLSGVCANLDSKVDETFALGRSILNSGVPIALRNLVLNASQKIDKKLQMEASKELLDRHGMFSKVSRLGLPTKEQDQGINAKDSEVANALVAALSTVNNPAPQPIDAKPVTEQVQ